jgi:L-serine dehydratase
MEQISVFDMLKIGVGPSSSHTLGPWRAAEMWIAELKEQNDFEKIIKIKVRLFGSISLTGKGHATDLAIMLGLNGEDPIEIDVSTIDTIIENISNQKEINFGGKRKITFDPAIDFIFEQDFLPFNPNGIRFEGITDDHRMVVETYFSIGGGFVVKEGEKTATMDCAPLQYPFPINTAQELIDHCEREGKEIFEIVLENEKSCRSEALIEEELMKIWDVMLECMYIGCHTPGILPGELKVKRRSFDMHQKLIRGHSYDSLEQWIDTIRKLDINFHEIFRWISSFALGVNEVNASLGRVVTSPTNGSAGVIPAVLMYYICFINKFAGEKEIQQFLLTAGEIGSIFKKGATISAALGGCQAEIGVSSAMAAGALAEILGGSAEQALVASEIAMEHHLGLTCDPVAGLVQVPCIERNAMGAVKAINAAQLALDTNPKDTLVPLDKVISTMWETAKDMHHKYKETSTGGLAVAVNMTGC